MSNLDMYPELRFKGLEDEWKEKKSKQLFQSISEKNQSKLPVLAVTQNNGIIFRNQLDIDIKFDKSSLSNYKVVHPSDFVISLRSFQGGFELSDKLGITSPAYTVFNFIKKDYHNYSFWFHFFKTYKFIESLKTVTFGIRDGRSISFKEFGDLKLKYPVTVKEQKKIGEFFNKLDELIILNQSKLDKLKELKKGYLQKMFPGKGETIPELRFKGFYDEWEEYKFIDCFNFPLSNNSLSRSMLNNDIGEIKNIHYGDILIKYSSILDVKNADISYITNVKKNQYEKGVLKNEDLIFADAAEDETVGKAVEINGITDESIVPGLHTIVARVKEKKAEYFLGYYINSNIYHRQLLRLMQGSKVFGISKGNLKKTNVSFPDNIQEQQKIGQFFKKLDELIDKQSENIDQLKELKKGYLQKMFV